MHIQNTPPSLDALPSCRTCQLPSFKDSQQIDTQKVGHCSKYMGSHVNCISTLQFIIVWHGRSAPELTVKIRSNELKPSCTLKSHPHLPPIPVMLHKSVRNVVFWAVLLLHKRCGYLKTKATYTRTLCKLKITSSVALTRQSSSPSCMHNLNKAILQERGRVSALGVSTCLHTDDMGRRRNRHSALYSYLLTFAVSSAISTLLQVTEEIHYPLLKKFFSNLLLFWLAQTLIGLWEFGSLREFASCALLAQPIQPSKPCNNSSFPHNVFPNI